MKRILLLSFALVLLAGYVSAQDLVYRPRNPAFGGDTFNYQWLLSSAQAQNKFAEDDSFNQDPLQQFQDDLNRQILNRLSSALIDQIFGENGELQDGNFQVGNFNINIFTGIEGIEIDIVDTFGGGQAQVLVPFF